MAGKSDDYSSHEIQSLFRLFKECFKVRSGTASWYRSSYGTDFDNSEIVGAESAGAVECFAAALADSTALTSWASGDRLNRVSDATQLPQPSGLLNSVLPVLLLHEQEASRDSGFI